MTDTKYFLKSGLWGTFEYEKLLQKGNLNLNQVVTNILYDNGYIVTKGNCNLSKKIENGSILVWNSELERFVLTNSIAEVLQEVLYDSLDNFIESNVDRLSNVCNGELITSKDLIGNELVCLQREDGSSAKITLSDLKDYFLTITTSGNNTYKLDVNDNGFMNNQDKTDRKLRSLNTFSN